MNLKHRLPLIALIFTSVLCIAISVFSLKSGQFTIFQNLFYIPIIVACFYYRKWGFAISVALSCIYFLLIIAFTSDPMIIRDAVIRVILFILIAAVITALSIARAQAEEALKKERERFRTVADFTYNWEYWTDPQQNMRYVSPSCERITGYRPEDFMAESGLMHSVVHPDDRDIFKCHADHYHEVHIDSVGEVDFRIVDRNGEERWIVHSCQPAYSSDGQFLGRRASNRDVSERKQAEEEKRAHRRQLTDIIEFLPDATLAIDKEGRVIIWNKAIEEMTNVPAAEIIGKGGHAYSIPFYGEARPQLMDLVFDDCEEITIRYPQITREGDTLMTEVFCNALYDNKGAWVIAKASPLHDHSGNIIGAIESIRDITPRKQAEESLARINAQLQAKNKELEQVVYVASHDLRSPLVNIDGYGRELEYAIEELKKALAADYASHKALKAAARSPVQEMSAALRYIRSSTTQMDALLTGLLKLSRSGRTVLTVAPLNMNNLISGVVAALDFQVKEAGVELHVSELPPCLGDAVQVSQVFTNLLSNALKYLDPARPGVIRISGVIEGKSSVYFVEDNGIGIAPAHQENIFEVFHRLEPGKCKGDGLGLTIVRQALGRLAGEVGVESKPGEGSRFSVALPSAHGGEK
jgi:PAS domain S-box-containing protein